MFRKTPRLVIAASHMGKRRGGSGRHMRYIVGSGKGRLGPMTYLQPLGDPQPLARPPAWKRMPGKELRLSEFRDGLRGTRIGQTHNDISGTIIGQMRLDQFALQ